MSLIRALFQLVNAQPLPPTERDRYLDILRSFITPEDATVILTALLLGRLPETDKSLVFDQRLLDNTSAKTRNDGWRSRGMANV